jgi:class 3 adenylate cyclase
MSDKEKDHKAAFNWRAALVGGGVVALGCVGMWIGGKGVVGSKKEGADAAAALRARNRRVATAVSRLKAAEKKAQKDGFAVLVESLLETGSAGTEEGGTGPGLAYVGVVDANGKLKKVWVAKKRLVAAVAGHSADIAELEPREVIAGLVSGELVRSKRLEGYSIELPANGGVIKMGFLTVPPPSRPFPWLVVVMGGVAVVFAFVILGFVLRGSAVGGATAVGRASVGRASAQDLEELERALVAVGGTVHKDTTRTHGVNRLLRAAAVELRAVGEQRKRLAPYLPRPIFHRVLKKVGLGQDEKAATVIAVGLDGLEAVMARESASLCLDMANTYLDVVVETLRKNGAVVGQVSLFGVLAWWGIYDTVSDAERRAVDAALQLRAGVEAESVRRRAVNEKTLAVTVGVATGRAMVGRVGSVNRTVPVLLGSAATSAVGLRDAAESGDILVCPVTAQRVESLGFDLADAGKKGPAGEPAWTVRGRR